MHFAVKIDATTGFHTGGTALTQRLVQPGPDGVIAIAVTGNVGIIDPDIARNAGGANRELLLQSVFFKHAGATEGANGDEITVVDDLGAPVFQVVNFDGQDIPFYSDRRWLIPLGYKLLVNFVTAGAATLRLNFWVLDSPEQIVAAPPI